MTVDTEVDISLHYGAELSGVDEDPGGWIPVTIRANGVYICGNGDPSNGVVGEGGYVVSEMLNSIISLGEGEKSVIEFSYHPFWIILCPEGEDSIGIYASSTHKGTTDLSERLEIDQSANISRTSWKTEVVNTAEEFITTIPEINPELEDHKLLEKISDQVSLVEDCDVTYD